MPDPLPTLDTRVASRCPRGSRIAGQAYWALVRQIALAAACIDLLYIGLFLWLGSMPLAWLNLASIVIYLGCYALIRSRRNLLALGLIWFEVLIHAAIGSLLIGWDSGFYYYLWLFVPMIVMANAGRFALPLVLFMLAYYLGLRAICQATGPLAPLSTQGLELVHVLHVCIVFAMFSVLAAFYRRTILRAEARLLEQATLDSLTGLNNRRQFHALSAIVLAECARNGEAMHLLLCDIDHFKQVNDQHGHNTGDEILKAVAQTLKTHLRSSDVLARWGGEEFIVLMPGCTTEMALACAERIRQAVTAPLHGSAGLLPGVTLSLGMSRLRDSQDLKAATARADAALYRSKDRGRNCVSLA